VMAIATLHILSFSHTGVTQMQRNTKSSLYFLHPVVYLILKVFLGAVNTTIDYKTDIKVLILGVLSISHCMFRSAEIIIRRSLNTYLLSLNCQLKWIHFLHLIFSN
jgi:hypothetical protein